MTYTPVAGHDVDVHLRGVIVSVAGTGDFAIRRDHDTTTIRAGAATFVDAERITTPDPTWYPPQYGDIAEAVGHDDLLVYDGAHWRFPDATVFYDVVPANLTLRIRGGEDV